MILMYVVSLYWFLALVFSISLVGMVYLVADSHTRSSLCSLSSMLLNCWLFINKLVNWNMLDHILSFVEYWKMVVTTISTTLKKVSLTESLENLNIGITE